MKNILFSMSYFGTWKTFLGKFLEPAGIKLNIQSSETIFGAFFKLCYVVPEVF